MLCKLYLKKIHFAQIKHFVQNLFCHYTRSITITLLYCHESKFSNVKAHIYVYLFIINGHKNGIVLHIKIIKSGNGYSELDIIPGNQGKGTEYFC